MKMSSLQMLENYQISPITGFLVESPLEELPDYFEPWNRLAKSMPDLVHKGSLRDEINQMPELETDLLQTDKELRLAHLQLSILGSGYVWQNGDKDVAKVVPRCLALPWYTVSQRLGVKPIISHPSFCLANWKVIDPEKPLCLDNMRSMYLLPGGDGCDWFTTITCATELEFAQCLKPIITVLQAVENNDIKQIIAGLQEMTFRIKNLKSIISRLHDRLSGDVFYNVLRPFLAGWGGETNPLPDGLIYEGCENNQPIKVQGGSAAQSCSLQIIDVVLGIKHNDDKKKFINEMRQYILPAHRQLISDIESQPKNVHTIVSNNNNEDLKKEYNTCLQAVADFRSYHIQIVTKYIVIASRKTTRNKEFETLAKTGTGGTNLIPFLKDLRKDTNDAVV